MAVDKSKARRLSVRLRTAAPGFVRRAYRIGRSIVDAGAASQPLPGDLVDGCELVSSRYQLIERLPKGGVGLEIGTQSGQFARHMLEKAEPSKLHVVDIDYSQFDDSLRADPRLVCHEGLSHVALEAFAPETFDWIYIDADHSYAGVRRDAEASATRLRPGGLLLFNDFAHIDPELGRYGVHRAVIDFALEHQWRLRYLAYHPSALYDVALIKPLTAATPHTNS